MGYCEKQRRETKSHVCKKKSSFQINQEKSINLTNTNYLTWSLLNQNLISFTSAA